MRKIQLHAVSAGFATVVTTGIELQVQQAARVDFALAVGQAAETIEVSANAGLLSTENATGRHGDRWSANCGDAFGKPSSSPFQLNDKYFQFVDNFSRVIGNRAVI